MDVTRSLLSTAGEEPLAVIARSVNQVAAANFTLVALPTPGHERMLIEVAVGTGSAGLLGLRFDIASSISGLVLRTGQAVVVDDVRNCAHSATVAATPGGSQVGPLMVVPLQGEKGTQGVLVIARRRGAPGFEDEDLELAVSFAGHAAVALELAAARADQQRMALLEDRHRIGVELHGHVLQRLFATGMSMQAIATAVGGPHADRLADLIADTDETIARIRAVIHDLRDAALVPPPS